MLQSLLGVNIARHVTRLRTIYETIPSRYRGSASSFYCSSDDDQFLFREIDATFSIGGVEGQESGVAHQCILHGRRDIPEGRKKTLDGLHNRTEAMQEGVVGGRVTGASRSASPEFI